MRPLLEFADAGVQDAGGVGTTPDLTVRNHDFDCGYDLQVTVDDGERVVFSDRVYVGPGWTRALALGLDEGLYDVTAELDTGSSDERACPVGQAPRHSVTVECGNGCVTITDGFR